MKQRKNLAWQLMQIQLIALIAFAIIILLWLPYSIQNDAENHAIDTAKRLAKQVKILRAYYTENIIKKVLDNKSSITPTVKHKEDPKGIPLPASMVHDIGDMMDHETFRLDFYSPFPFKNRDERELTSFGKRAWQALTLDPNKPFFERQSVDGRTYIQVALADTMVNEVCVDCHNTHPLSPKIDWKINDLRGIIEVSSDITDQVNSGRQAGYVTAIALLVFFGFIMLLLFKKTLREVNIWKDNLSYQENALIKAQKISKSGSWNRSYLTEEETWTEGVRDIFGLDEIKNTKSKESILLDCVHPDDKAFVLQEYVNGFENATERDIEYRIVRKDNGDVRWIHERSEYLLDDNGKTLSLDITLHDITERKNYQKKIESLAMTDQLTGLANRTMFNQRFDEYLSLAKRENFHLALMLLDLDKFKPVNDTYGHQAGDQLLHKVSEIFKDCIRETDLVARLGGDEFAIILINADKLHGVASLAKRVISQIEKPFDIMGHQIRIGTSIGVAFFPDDDTEKEDLIRKADIALYSAKESGRNDFHFYEKEMEEK